MRQQRDRIFYAILRMVTNRDEAENLMQETFYQAYRNLHTFKGTAKASTWLYRIAMNVTVAHLRRAWRSRPVCTSVIEHLPGAVTTTAAQQGWQPDYSIELDERAKLLHAAIAQLPEKYRRVVELRDLHNLSTTETAQILGIEVVNVRVRLHRAHKYLRESLGQYFTNTTAD